MRTVFRTHSLRSTSPNKHLTGWRWALVVTLGSVVLFAALLVLGVGIAAMLGVNITAPKTVQPNLPVARVEQTSAPDPALTPAASSSAVTQASAQAADLSAAISTASNVPSVCDTIVAHYSSLLSDLAKTKPVLSVNTALSGLTATLKGQYNARAATYNASFDSYQAEYTQEVAANSCGLLASPFDGLTKALVL